MKLTVLGAGGFIGAALCRSLRAQGHEVLTPARGADPRGAGPLGQVVYAIGVTADFRTRPFDTMRAHVCVLSDWLEHGDFESFLYLSTTRIYGGSRDTCETARPAVDPADPSDLYNLSKLAGESLCLNSGRRGVRIARLSNVVGMDRSAGNFLSSLIRDALAGQIHLRTAMESEKDYILLDDVVDLLGRLAIGPAQGIYNVASGSNLAHAALVEELARITGCSVSVTTGAPAVSFPVIEIARIRRDLDYTPTPVLPRLGDLIAAWRAASGPAPGP